MTEKLKIIDTDVHNTLKSHMELVPFLKEPWKSRMITQGLYLAQSYPNPYGVFRKDAYPPSGTKPGSDPDYLLKQLVEAYDIEYALLNGEEIMHVSAIPDPDYAAAIASAYNDHLIENWLSKIKKFKGSLVVTTQDPHLAAREIDRLGSHPDIVQVIMTSGARMPYGQRFYHPIYEAAERNGLVVAIHPGSEGCGMNNPPTPAGYPSNYLQWHTSLSQNFMAHLISLVCDGVFEKFPNLKFVLIEGGIAWLPHLMWRLDKNFKALRAQAPWLKRMPSEYIRDHCYLTTQPIEEPENFKHLEQIFDMIDGDHIIMFSSDYPHWDQDEPTEVLKRLPLESKKRIFYENAKNLYKL